MRAFLLQLGVVFALWLLCASPAAAQITPSCDISITPVNFDSVDILNGGAIDTTATVTANCTGTRLLQIRICPSIGAGSGGADASARYMQGPAGTLAYQLYTDASRTTVWGSNYWGLGGSVPNIDVMLSGGIITGSGTVSRTIYARLFGGQQAAPTGSYVSNFTAADDVFNYNYNTIILNCLSLPLVGQTENPTFTVSASIDKSCTVSATDLDFGTQGALSANIDAAGEVSARCTAETPYTIALSNGISGTGPTARKMTMGAAAVTYGIYQDAGRTQPWGSAGAALLSATGNGTAQTHQTFGRVPPQATPEPGTYTDTIVVTLTY